MNKPEMIDITKYTTKLGKIKVTIFSNNYLKDYSLSATVRPWPTAYIARMTS